MSKKQEIPGRWVRQVSGYSAFIPDPLPPKIKWNSRLTRSLSDADRLLGQLSGEGKRLPNPHLLIRSFVKREAVYSSRIEGTQASLGELLASDAGAQVERSPADLLEVGNYVKALDYGVKRLKSFPLSLRFVREIHEKLMKGLPGSGLTPGEFRRSQNWIGAPGSTIMTAGYVPPPPGELLACLSDWERFLHDQSLPPLQQAALMHYQFEAIHPFLDGNGRVGRQLIVFFLMERNLLPSPLLYLSAFFENSRLEYYQRLSGVSKRGEWTEWLEYFLNGVARQAEDALNRTEKINLLIEKWDKRLGKSSSDNPQRMLKMLIENPFLTITNATKKLDVAYTTAQRSLEYLQKKGIIKQVGDSRRDRVYCAEELLRILE